MTAEFPVVFVLGAGASAPYGFPTANPLKDKISEVLSHNQRAASALLAADFSREEIGKFVKELRRFQRDSIDEFLEEEPDFVKIGKAAIVSVLLPLEADTDLTDTLKEVEGGWYRLLYNRLFPSGEPVGRVKTAFVNFNYDRSLDEYLVQVLAGASRGEVSSYSEVLSRFGIQITHPYGTLGAPYGSPLGGLDIRACAENIHVIGESAVTEDQAFKEARSIIAQAETICFLGFGYHKDNITRLKISNEWPEGSFGDVRDHNEDNPVPQKNVVGTALELRGREVKLAKGHFPGVPVEFGHRQWDVLRFLEETDILDKARGEPPILGP